MPEMRLVRIMALSCAEVDEYGLASCLTISVPLTRYILLKPVLIPYTSVVWGTLSL
jgi:hypothetical protein